MEWLMPDQGEFMTELNRDNIIKLVDVKNKRTQDIVHISDETIEAITFHSPLPINIFHLELASAQFDCRQQLDEATIADGLVVHYNVPQRCLRVLDSDVPDDTYSVPLGLLLDLYNLTGINLKLALTYQYEDEDEIEIRYLHADTKTVLDMINMKQNYIERLIGESNMNLAEAQNYLVRQLMHIRSEAIEAATLNLAWAVASNLASSDTNGVHLFFIPKPKNYERVQANFQKMQPEELYEILSDKLTIDDIFETLEEFMSATEIWLLQNKEKIKLDVKYSYANAMLDKYNFDLALDEDLFA